MHSLYWSSNQQAYIIKDNKNFSPQKLARVSLTQKCLNSLCILMNMNNRKFIVYAQLFYLIGEDY